MQIAPYGTWRSPITSDLIVGATIGVGSPMLDGDDLYWIEARPLDGGRSVLVRQTSDGRVQDVTPADYYVRTRVHEYGGSAYTVADGVVYFVNFADQRLYRQVAGAAPEPLTAATAMRYADMVVDVARQRLICVGEDHSVDGEPENLLIAVSLTDGTVTPLVRGRNFYMSPCLSADGQQLAWICWDHPFMPWDAGELWVAPLDSAGMPGTAQQLAGGVGDSAMLPQWGPDGGLFFIAERTGWWNLYRFRNGSVTALCPRQAEFGAPQWVFGMTTYAVIDAERLICCYCESGVWSLATLDCTTGQLTPFELPYTGFYRLRADRNHVIMVAVSPVEHTAIILVDIAAGTPVVLRRSSETQIDPGYLSYPETVSFPTTHGRLAYGFFYPPVNADYNAPDGELPPLLVMSHGGPTSATSSELNLEIQYWTSRGIAVLDVNYGGSTGYGREYRERLAGQWGIVDVDDCANGARYLVAQSRVDGQRLMITGGSAGGYTTLAALTFRDVFKAGASHFGIGDLEALARDTHKFESRYLDGLVGPYPERIDLYHERSPIHHVGALECPVIFFQGLEDKVVPPQQAEAMVAALRTKGIPVAYVPFEGEQHGFRKAENIKRALEGEFWFYGRVLGFTPADAIEPVAIENIA